MVAQGSLFAEPLRVRGLTFWEPWASAIVRPVPEGATAPHAKRIDNRRSAPGSLVGGLLVIQTGRTFDSDGLAWLRSTYNYPWTGADLSHPGYILGVARVTGFVTSGEHPWFFGPTWKGKPNVGWTLDDVVAFNAPMIFTPKCGLGQWSLPPYIEREVVARWKAGKL